MRKRSRDREEDDGYAKACSIRRLKKGSIRGEEYTKAVRGHLLGVQGTMALKNAEALKGWQP